MPTDIFGHVPSPTGTIAYWDDDPVNLPAGWVVCDGNNGTPNLLDEFLKNVPDGSTNPGSLGGQHSYTLSQQQLPSHDHNTGSTGTNGSHNHSIHGIDGSDNGTDVGSGGEQANSDGITYSISGGNHSHSLNLLDSGSSSSFDNRPKFAELVPVMKT